MELVLLLLALATLAYLVFSVIEVQTGLNKIKNLSSQMIVSSPLPSVSIIFSALNEESVLENVINALLKLDYPQFEIIVVNDRSTDNTRNILEKFEHEIRFQAKHIDYLPKGWLGKNYALHMAAQTAKGEWLLFTDADVVMKSQTLTKSLSYVIEKQLDHLTIFEHQIRKTFWLKILSLATYVTYCMGYMPWRASDSRSKKSVGQGAFNLVKKSVYTSCGGHQAIAMECLDDLQLGALIKRHQFRQDIADGQDLIEREWYSSAAAMIQGLEKNAFASFHYSFFIFSQSILLAGLFYLWPCIAALILTGPVQWLNLLNIMLTTYITLQVCRFFRLSSALAVFYPAGIILLLYTICHSALVTYRNTGIIWRDTFYSLQELRNKK